MKRNINRLLAIITAVSLLIGLSLPAFAAQSSTGFSYEVITGSTDIRITGYSGNSSEIVVPDVIDGRTVVEIGARAFYENSKITGVSIASSVRTVRAEAFKGSPSLRTVTIPASVTTIGDSAFANCVSLSNISISSASTAIGYYAFEGCTSLKSVVIPSAKIKDDAFKNCTMLESITLLDSVKSVGRGAFDGTAWYNLQSNGLMMIDNVVYSWTGNETEVVLPENTRCIADFAFSGNNVSSVVIPDGVYYIGNRAFYNCPNMKYISVPESVINIDMRAFGYDSKGVVSGFTVYAYASSTAYLWAVNNSLNAEDISDCGHRYGDWQIVREANCTENGEQIRRCIMCNNVETEEISALGHRWGGDVVISELSCTTDGVTRKTCTVCGETEDTVVTAPGHSWGKMTVIKEPNCTENGESEHICSVCGTAEKEEIPALGHTWTVNENTDSEGWVVDTDATCTEQGQKSRTCSVCGFVETQAIAPKGHTADEWTVIKDPTAVTPGLREGVCTVCGETFTDEIPVKNEDLPDDVKLLSLIDNSTFSFNEARTGVLGVSAGMTVTDVLLQFNYPSHIKITDRNLNELEADAKVSTGCLVFLMKVNPETEKLEAVDTTNIVVKGDVDGNGAITAADARLALRASAKLESLNIAAFLSADVDSNNSVTAGDARTILRVASRLETF